MLTLAGVGVAHVDHATKARVNRWLTLDRVRPFLNRSWPGPGNVFLSWPTGYEQWPPPLKLNHLYWPLGASRWACGAFLVSNAEPDKHAEYIHDQAFGQDGTQVNPIKLHIDSPSAMDGQAVESVDIPKAYVMAIIPIQRVLPTGSGASYQAANIFVVADQRVFWWDAPCPDFHINEGGSTTWKDLIDQCASNLNISGGIQNSDISADYMSPSRALNLTDQPLPPILDAIATNLGMKVVVGYDGNVQLQDYKKAKQVFDDDWDNNSGRAGRALAGDSRFLGNL